MVNKTRLDKVKELQGQCKLVDKLARGIDTIQMQMQENYNAIGLYPMNPKYGLNHPKLTEKLHVKFETYKKEKLLMKILEVEVTVAK